MTFNLTVTALSDGSNSAPRRTRPTRLDDTLMAGPPSAVVSENVHQEQQASGAGMSEHVSVQAMMALATPLVDFGDRTDLDQLPVGHADEATVRVTTNATATASAPGVAPRRTPRPRSRTSTSFGR